MNVTSRIFKVLLIFSRSCLFIFNIKGVLSLFPACYILLACSDLSISVLYCAHIKIWRIGLFPWVLCSRFLGGCWRLHWQLLNSDCASNTHGMQPSSETLWFRDYFYRCCGHNNTTLYYHTGMWKGEARQCMRIVFEFPGRELFKSVI